MAEGNWQARASYPSPPSWPPPPPLQPPPPRRRRWGWALVLLATLLVAALIGIGITNAISRPVADAAGRTSSTSGLHGAALGSGGGLDVSAVAAAVDPGLVDVNSTLGYQQAQGAGTGIVLRSSGLILTNNHVIRGATALSVTDIGNGRTYPATVVGYDVTHDIAVLQAKGASGLATAPIGDSGSVAVGDAVVGIGNAGGTGGTPSTAPGSVTALNRTITVSDDSGGSQQLSGLIQVAANVQPGDSGGPLANAAGEVVGVDTAASTSNGGSANGSPRAGSGEGYAIPISDALNVANQITDGSESATVHVGATGFLGVGVQDAATPGRGRHRGETIGRPGATVLNVTAGSPAEDAGLVAGDVIVAIDGDAVDSANTLTTLLTGHHPGDTLQLSWASASGSAQTGSVQLVDGPPA